MASVLIRKIQPYCKCKERVLRIRQTVENIGVKSCTTSTKPNEVTVEFSAGEEMVVGSGKLAKLADGCAVVNFKGTTVVATVVSRENQKVNESFLPLTVSYHQKAAALGRIPLNYIRREVGQSEQDILVSRMIDRSVRPLFPEGFNWETQIICSPLALDGHNFPDVLGINAASAALAISSVPWNGPVGAVRVGFVNGKCVLNPTKQELIESELNLILATRNSKMVTMIEGMASNLPQSDLFKCLKFAVKECGKVISGILKLQQLCGKEKRIFEDVPPDPELVSEVKELAVQKLRDIFQNYTLDKMSRDKAVFEVWTSVLENLAERKGGERLVMSRSIFDKICKEVFRELIFETGYRCDGRTLRELRQMSCEVDLFSPLHGSALFQRGQTQVFCTVALDSPNSALRMDRISMLTSGLKEKNFFVHYEFPPFATNETGRTGPIGRREIGHGVLAEKALKSNIPSEYPFTIRLTSEVLESNGSSSMATVCGGTLALLDAGVPLKSPCAGVAMGLLSKCNPNGEITEYRILSDLLGIEDYMGEMDFKIAGTKKAYTALQLDVKNKGVPLTIVYEILSQGKEAISQILGVMKETLPEVRSSRKPNWPEKHTLKVPPHLRFKFLGPGGLNIKKLMLNTGVDLTEEAPGEFSFFAPNAEAWKEANLVITELLNTFEEHNLEFGGVYVAVITELKSSGCMVTLHPSMKPVHMPLSQLDVKQVSHPSALGLTVGQEIRVKYFGRDPISGAMRLSRKVLMGPASEVARKLHKAPNQPVTESEDQLNSLEV